LVTILFHSDIFIHAWDYNDDVATVWDRYQILEELGKGAYGKVLKAQRNSDGLLVAIKVTTVDKDDGLSATTIRELITLKSLSGRPFIAKFYESYISKTELFIVMEYANKDLNIYIKECHAKGGMEMEEIRPENIVVTRDTTQNLNIAKIIDFGLSRTFSVPVKPYSPEIQTVLYRAPEIFFQPDKEIGFAVDFAAKKFTKDYDARIDIWSVGCIAAEMIMGQPIFYGHSEIAVKSKIVRYRFYLDCALITNILSMLGVPQKGDFNFEAVETDAFFVTPDDVSLEQVLKLKMKDNDTDCLDLILRMLTMSPKRRIHIISALKHPFFNDIRPMYKKLLPRSVV
ncbi:kinase-like domain-containing protein, partial [Chytridium lagenaria]